MAATPPDDFVSHICEMLAPMGEVTVRRMFGGYCLFCDGITFALVADGTLYLKADDENRQAFIAAGLEPFRPFPDKPTTMSYYPLPESALDEGDDMLFWARPAFDAGLRAAAKKKKKAGGARSRKSLTAAG